MTLTAFFLLMMVSGGADLCIGMLDAVGLTMQKMELQELGVQIEQSYAERGWLPDQDSFAQFCAERMKTGGRTPGKDRWGTVYWIETVRFEGKALEESEYVLVSAGPDRKWRTKDDLVYRGKSASVFLRRPLPPSGPPAGTVPGTIWPPRRR